MFRSVEGAGDMASVSLFGVLVAMVAYAVSVSPSLLPRSWWWHAFVSGSLMGLGYTLGWGLQSLGAWLLHVSGIHIAVPESTASALRIIALVAASLWTLRAIVHNYIDSRKTARLIGVPPTTVWRYLLGLASSFLMLAFVLLLVDLLLRIFHLVVSLLSTWVYRPVAITVAIAVLVVIILVVSNKVVFKWLMVYFAYRADLLNTAMASHLPPPHSPQRSGSPQSLQSWSAIGGQGRIHLTLGPDASQIERLTGRPAVEPVRVYVGLPKQGANLEALADQAVAELQRAGGFDRAVILVNTTTGSGWVDEWLVQPLEYLTGGDCATVSMQYSYLYSAAMLVSDLTDCRRAGTLLFEKVWQHVQTMPADTRPLIMVSGESLGALGSQAAFTDLQDLNARTDGALWVGPPFKSGLSRLLTEGRHKGSPEVAPVYQNGLNARFVNEPAQLTEDLYGRQLGPWHFPRSVFAQHASDPVVWYTPYLMLREPDWIRERAGLDVSPSIRFTPFATYLQVLADLPMAGTVPGGHGHTYHEELIDAWFHILGLEEDTRPGRVGDGQWFTPEVRRAVAQAIDEDVRRPGLKQPVET